MLKLHGLHLILQLPSEGQPIAHSAHKAAHSAHAQVLRA
jgi:hypothetical protein